MYIHFILSNDNYVRFIAIILTFFFCELCEYLDTLETLRKKGNEGVFFWRKIVFFLQIAYRKLHSVTVHIKANNCPRNDLMFFCLRYE